MDDLHSGERQVAPILADIRRDHVARYEWAAERFSGSHIVDAGCGVGYGAKILADAGCTVRAYDRSESAIAFARQFYNHDERVTYVTGRAEDVSFPQNADAVVAFELIEHLSRPEIALRRFSVMAPRLVVSVPNEEVFPYHGSIAFHVRHYTREQLARLLELNGWRVMEWWGQEGPHSEVAEGVNGRTLLAVAERVDEPVALPDEAPEGADDFALPGRALPNSVAIVAMGPSVKSYVNKALAAGGKWRFVDEVWAVNQTATIIYHDRAFYMDDLRIAADRAELRPEQPLAGLVERLKTHDTPLYSSRAYPEFPTAVDYPLEFVLNATGHSYFNNSVPLVFAFALALGVQHIHLFGCDYSYAGDEAWKREQGRACLEYWMAVAAERRVMVHMTTDTTLMDAEQNSVYHHIYGYDTEWLTIELDPRPADQGGGFTVTRVDRKPEDIPTAKQLEARYSHDERLERLEAKVR